MPAHVCHALAGRRALIQAAASGAFRDTDRVRYESDWPPAFNLGCQGPDVFAHNRRTRPLALAYARLLHRRGYGSFSRAFAERLGDALRRGDLGSDAPFDAALAWIRGFVTHQAIDRALHPYIAYRSHIARSARFPFVNSARFHAFFERLLDSWIHLRLEGGPVSLFDTGKQFALDAASSRFLASLIASAARDVYVSAVEDADIGTRILNAFADASYFYEMTNPAVTSMGHDRAFPDRAEGGLREFVDMGAAGVALLHPETRDDGVDWLNERRAPWRDPVDGSERSESAIDLFDAGVSEAACCLSVLERVMDGGTDGGELARVVGDGPLSVVGLDGKAAAVAFCDPFDLESALGHELAARREWVAGRPSVDRAKRELV